jgi:DNA-binding CsgD family transcriptional regulator/signal transduction protein with GAF and PtsI domain
MTTPMTVDAPGAFALLQDAVRQVVGELGGEVAFGGLVGAAGDAPLLATHGVDASRFAALAPRPGRGLGGRVLADPRPQAVGDYGAAAEITDDYLTSISAEGLRGIGCVPVRVGDRPLGLLYVASRDAGAPGERLLDAVDRLALVTGARIEERRRTAAETARIRAELVAHRARLERARRRARTDGGADLLAASRAALAAVERSLDVVASAPGDPFPDAPATHATVALTPREREVLALLRTGASNRRIADRLVVSEATVKGHVGNLKQKLGADSRLHIIVRAGDLGIA